MLKKIIHFGICLIILVLPLYLFKLKIWLIPLTILELLIYGVFVLWLIEKRGRSLFIKWRAAFVFPIFLIFLGLTISTLFSADLLVSAGIWKGWFMAPWLFFIVFLDSVKNQKQIRDILIALTISGGGVAVIGLWYWFFDDLTYDGRLKAFYLSPNHLAMYLTPILILGFGLWGFLKDSWQKLLLLVVSCLLLVVIYLTYSHGAWLGLIVALGFFVGIRCHPERSEGSRRFIVFATGSFASLRMTIIIISFIALAITLLIFSQLQTEKFQNILNFSRSSLESRLIIWRTAIEIIKTTPHNFLWGVGPGLFQRYYLAYQPKFKPYLEWAASQPHNLFLAFWLQTGLIGLIGFILLLIWFFSRFKLEQLHWSSSEFQNCSNGAAPISRFLSAAMVYILIHGLVDTTYWKNDLAIIFWLIIALASITARLSYSQKTNNLLGAREGAK
ncbi:MAG: hypothetical protein A2646_00095 [Candidatus Portnoybacteria bacterium RIFCSPHIGHO2_02_FULL_39_12]|uniref:O-antigen ligase-related domain-containing protein n=1 Tax=Candidatus Portnoybacteria bacterium RIFCSPHIGHO2_12_FULL_38_9 TaxID=1801997 RepID=A0A1G2FHC2_9BACT|nr:MAG: hypothetical protein A3H00_01195 [Candidatus Portnoybacteria bacterium RBG_13_40_8]OGZ36571.1 MAG: hypothetical protein A2646_00095 [Candidatus Portnoybacteria bacterium RIFCSPHIGHO2_02_FULL_39_12]OGZ37465.1 MAG: hypothetical protein A3J64_00520 [Candidatus Portnoybacteria bacterium RIFCSPHIGHO2_12_FULL_38_9]OGZ39111.1 MAG: hypothetical protein A3F21_00095 [Candidatus Portnoybacteria bacterium RIFCSPLOWO2_01_FULL_38_39]